MQQQAAHDQERIQFLRRREEGGVAMPSYSPQVLIFLFRHTLVLLKSRRDGVHCLLILLRAHGSSLRATWGLRATWV
jgi:hypothetical protein